MKDGDYLNFEDNPQPRELNNRLIGFFDILGFSQILQTRPVSEVHALVSNFIDEARSKDFINEEVMPGNQKRATSNFSVTQFAFDTLVLVSEAHDQEHADANFLFACSQIFERAMRVGLPLRGAIGVGDVLADVKRGMILSNQLPKIHRVELAQEWSGVAVLDEAFQRLCGPLFGEGCEFSSHAPIVPWTIPLKEGVPVSDVKYALNWLAASPDDVWKSTIDFLTEPKKQNTIHFINSISGAEDYGQRLEPPVGEVFEFRYTSCRVKVRFLFLGVNGQPVEPTVPLTITISDGKNPPRMLTFLGQLADE